MSQMSIYDRVPILHEALHAMNDELNGLENRNRALEDENKRRRSVVSLERKIVDLERRIAELTKNKKIQSEFPQIDAKSAYFSEIAKLRNENELLRSENQHLKCGDGAFEVDVNKIRSMLEIPTQSSAILYCLLSASNGFLTYENLSRRVSESESVGSIRVQLSYLRKALRSRALGDVETVFGEGLRISPKHSEAIRHFLDGNHGLNIVAPEPETREELAA